MLLDALFEHGSGFYGRARWAVGLAADTRHGRHCPSCAARREGPAAMPHLPNPLLPGFNPDPTVVRVGDDYYACTSTFEYLPGLPIYHSRDFAHWTLVGHVATREAQLDIRDVPTGTGVYAPTLRFHDGLFHLVVTCVRGRGLLLFTAPHAAGPWSDGTVIDGVEGIDPDLCWDEDGAAYLTYAGLCVDPHASGFLRHRGIEQVRVDLRTGRVLGEPRTLWRAADAPYAEAPHLYRIDGWWYLLIAEGGTERGHALSVARSQSPQGPFLPAPGNPLLTARGTDRPVQGTAHGDLVQGPDGQWLCVLLGVRPQGATRAFSTLGRETFVTRVDWRDGWPVFEPVVLAPRAAQGPLRTRFEQPGLGPEWMAVRRMPCELADLVSRPGWLVLRGRGEGMESRHPVFLGRRQVHLACRVTVSLDAARGTGGICLRYSEDFHYGICAGGGRIRARACIPGFERVRELACAVSLLQLEIACRPPPHGLGHTSDIVELAAIVAGERTVLLAVDGRYLSAEVAESFAGRVVGPYAQEGDVAFEWFEEEGSDA
jgi:beta-xylosidase